MENKAHALAAGVFVLLVSALLVAMAMWLTRDVTNTTAYELTTADGVNGLQVQAAVRYKGVAIGKVTDIRFDPQQRSNVLVRIAVSPQAPITASTFATLAFQGVTGLSFIQLDDTGGSTEPPPPGPDGVPRIALRPNPLGQISDQASVLIGKVDQAVERINQVLAPENQAKLTQALAEVGAAAASADRLARTADQTLRTQLDPARADLPGLIRQASSTLKATEGVATDARRTLATLDAVAGDARQGLARLERPRRRAGARGRRRQHRHPHHLAAAAEPDRGRQPHHPPPGPHRQHPGREPAGPAVRQRCHRARPGRARLRGAGRHGHGFTLNGTMKLIATVASSMRASSVFSQ
jgi:phospholipid/cholesterol/gamma-HCH transport system substrate-binding protein